jgi:glutaredoxin
MEIKLYTTHCPQCKVLETKLNRKSIDYSTCDDINEMKQLGFKSAPVLKVGDKYYGFSEAIKWVNTVE